MKATQGSVLTTLQSRGLKSFYNHVFWIWSLEQVSIPLLVDCILD
jgi:hypothetical protein